MCVTDESDQSDSDGPAAFTDDNKAWLKPAKLPLSDDDDDDDDLVRIICALFEDVDVGGNFTENNCVNFTHQLNYKPSVVIVKFEENNLIELV